MLNAASELPLAFVENRGQIDSRVRYYVHGARAAVFLTGDSVVMSLRNSAGAATESVALALRFVGSNPAMSAAAEGRVRGNVNYLWGHDPSRWRTEVPRFGQLVYREVWPGVDVVLRGGAATLKYVFRLRPGARPSDMRLAYDGASGLTLDRDGALRIDTAIGPVRDSAPVAWQEIDGARHPDGHGVKRRPVPVERPREGVTGDSSSTGTVALTAGAPAGGAAVALSSSNDAAANVPASVLVAEGLTSTTFTVITAQVSANTESTISATYNGTTRSATLGVNAADGPALSMLALDPMTVPGGSTSTGTVTLTGAAPSGGAIVTLNSSLTGTATVPQSVTVPAGETTATFTVSTSP